MTRAIVLIDSSVFLEILNVPGKAQHHVQVLAELSDWMEENASLILPMATILETGNLIAQVKSDKRGRRLAEYYVTQIHKAMSGESPFGVTRAFDPEQVLEWIGEYPDYAERGIGLGDLSIIKEWESQCRASPHKRVLIWTRDKDLSGYDNRPDEP